MEVTLVHPENKDQKVLVKNKIQYDAFLARGFVQAAEDEKKDVKAAQSPALKANPTADASKDEPQKERPANDTADVDRKNAAATGEPVQSDHKAANAKKETK